MVFSKRKELAEKYKGFAEENGVLDCALSVITYLEGEGLLTGKAHLEIWHKEIETELGTEHDPHYSCSQCKTEIDPKLAKFVNYCYVCGSKIEKGEMMRMDIKKPYELEKMVSDDPKTMDGTMLNYAYAKDKKVFLRYAGLEENVDLCEYISKESLNKCDFPEGVSADEVMEGACLECDSAECPLRYLYFAAVQAAELRERLRMYENHTADWVKTVAERNGNANCSRCGYFGWYDDRFCSGCGSYMKSCNNENLKGDE